MRSGRLLPVLLAFLILGPLATPSWAVTPIFLIDTDAGLPGRIYRVNAATGQLTTVGTLPLEYGEVAGLAAVSQNVLYVTTMATPVANRVLRVTVSPFSFQELGAVGGT